jgi:hypothetical protein
MVTMDVLKSNQSRVQNLSPLEIWGFIVGRALAAFGLGILAAQYFPRYAPQLGFLCCWLGSCSWRSQPMAFAEDPRRKTSLSTVRRQT